MEFRGDCLLWPWGKETCDLNQTANNIRSLREFLSGAIGDPVSVTGILTLPGWMIDRMKPPFDVNVLNPKEIIKFVDSKEQRLSENLIKRICYQLEEKCKLEFE